MGDVIQLLPDAVANQIAAGEVIQRPASAVKELLENAIDAGADNIALVIKDAGKALIQVVDNGAGMTASDAELSFQRHATSKIKAAADLFDINTKGFRGEALASIAAIAHVELKTKQEGEDLGTQLCIEGSEIVSNEPCATAKGSSFSIKNLFYNVPARRNFLKSNPVETKHIIEEFQRVALIHPDIKFTMHHNDQEVFNLNKGSYRQRIVAMFGDRYNQRLVPVSESTDLVTIEGFVGKPEFAKKTRGEQYFFVNDRFIKSSYLHHAVQNAFDQLISNEQFPSYFLRLTLNPANIDINIHPTKTEIKFDDERAIYAIMRTAVKQALGKFNIAPTLDFEQETSFNVPLLKKTDTVKPPSIKVNPSYNPFESEKSESKESKSSRDWDDLQRSFEEEPVVYATDEKKEEQQVISTDWDTEEAEEKKTLLQLHNKYILAQLKSGVLIIDQQRAHERILFEKYSSAMENGKGRSQQLLFPETVEFNAADGAMIEGLEEELSGLGFAMDKVGRSSYVVNGAPVECADQDIKKTIESLLEQFKMNDNELSMQRTENIAFAMARSAAIKAGKPLSDLEMNALVDELFACEMPYNLPNGKPTIITLNLDDLNQQFDYS